MEEAVKNIWYFFNIVLKSVRQSHVWTAEALKKAVNWAYYCEKVCKEAVDKGYADHLENVLEELSKFVDSGRLAVSLETLRNAPRILFMELLAMHPLKLTSCDFLLNSKFMTEAWAKDVMCDTLVLTSAMKTLISSKCQVQLGCLTDAHLQQIDRLQDKEYMDEHFQELLRTSPELLTVLALKAPPSVLEWLTSRLSPSSPFYDASFARAIWNQDASSVVEAAASNDGLLECLLAELERNARLMEPCYSSSFPWVSNGPWDVEKMTSVWKLLQNTESPSVRNRLREFCSAVVTQPGSAFWEDLLSL